MVLDKFKQYIVAIIWIFAIISIIAFSLALSLIKKIKFK